MRKIIFLAPLMLGLAITDPSVAQENLSPAQKEEVVKILRQHLMDNPELIMEAIGVLQKREDQKQFQQTSAKAKSMWSALSSSDNAIVVGNPNGDVTIVEFFDYQCGFCRKQHESTTALLAADKNIRYVYRPFPIKDVPGETPFSLIGAHMAFAASKQGKFEALHHALFTGQPISAIDMEALFLDLGINQDMVTAELQNQTAMNAIIASMEMADNIGLSGTPSLIINGELNPGMMTLEAMKAKVAAARKALKK